jgi:hypothetical protein
MATGVGALSGSAATLALFALQAWLARS